METAARSEPARSISDSFPIRRVLVTPAVFSSVSHLICASMSRLSAESFTAAQLVGLHGERMMRSLANEEPDLKNRVRPRRDLILIRSCLTAAKHQYLTASHTCTYIPCMGVCVSLTISEVLFERTTHKKRTEVRFLFPGVQECPPQRRSRAQKGGSRGSPVHSERS